MAGIAALKGEFNLFSDGDDWGNTVHWWFVIADEIYFNRETIAVPDEWKFRPSPLGPQNDDDDMVVGIIRETNDDDLLRFGAIIHRYARRLKHQGKDY